MAGIPKYGVYKTEKETHIRKEAEVLCSTETFEQEGDARNHAQQPANRGREPATDNIGHVTPSNAAWTAIRGEI